MSANEQIFDNANDLGNNKVQFKLRSSNATPDNTFRYVGSGVINFQIPNAACLLDPSTLRITGRFKMENGGLNVEDTQITKTLGSRRFFKPLPGARSLRGKCWSG